MVMGKRLLSSKEGADILKNVRVAVCGNLPAACNVLKQVGVYRIDNYSDALDLVFKLRKGEKYHLILVYAPQGEGLYADMPYKIMCEGEWQSIPIKLLNEPACDSALRELRLTVYSIVAEQLNKQ